MQDARQETPHDPVLTGLLGSRICHDLISPLGAIGNGLELLQMSGAPQGPELQLISESVANANAKIRFFRVAFGTLSDEQMLGRDEIVSLLHGVLEDRRLTLDWQPRNHQPRSAVKLVFLAQLCLEAAMPWGGALCVTEESGRWRARGSAARLRLDPACWRMLGAETAAADRAADPGPASRAIAPSEVQFALLPDLCRSLGRPLEAEIGPDFVEIRF